MSAKMPKIQVIDTQSEQVLFTCSVQESNKAYAYAAEMEAMGLDVKVISPTLADTLSASLGLSPQEQAKYQQSMEDEMDQHEGSCCFEDSSKNKILN